MSNAELQNLTASLQSAPSARRVTLDAGDVLIHQGDDADSVYLLMIGELEVSRTVESQELMLAKIDQPGTLIGEMVALGGGKRTATVRAISQTELVATTATDFRRLLVTDPDLGRDLVSVAVRRAEEAELVDILARHFGIDDEDTLVATSGTVEWRRLTQGETLFESGDKSDGVFFVVRGRLISKGAGAAPGEMVEVGEAGRGDVVGEMELLAHTPRRTTARAIRDTLVARMDEETFLGLIERHPRMMIELTLRASERANNPRWRSAPSTILALVTSDRVDLQTFIDGMGRELARYGSVGVLSREAVDNALETTGIADSARGDIGEVRVSRLVNEHELESEHLVLDVGSEPGPWSERALGMADRVLVFVPPDLKEEEARHLEQVLGGCPHGLARTLVVVHSAKAVASGTRWIKDRLGAGTVLHAEAGSATDLSRVARIASGRAHALILSGGGGRGFAHIGVFQALNELNHQIDIVGGTSIGGILATAIAEGLAPDEIIGRIVEYFPKTLDYTLPIVSLAKGRRVARSAQQLYGERDVEDLWLPYFAVATDLTTSRPHVIDSGSIAAAIRATSALPGVMPPVPSGERLLVDGGVLNNIPMDVAREWAPIGTVVASDVAPPRGPGAHGDYGLSVSGWEALRSRLGRARSSYPRISSVLMRSMITASMRERDSQVTRGLADCYIEVDMRGVSMLDFDDPHAAARRGYEAAMPVLENWLASGQDA